MLTALKISDKHMIVIVFAVLNFFNSNNNSNVWCVGTFKSGTASLFSFTLNRPVS